MASTAIRIVRQLSFSSSQPGHGGESAIAFYTGGTEGRDPSLTTSKALVTSNMNVLGLSCQAFEAQEESASLQATSAEA